MQLANTTVSRRLLNRAARAIRNTQPEVSERAIAILRELNRKVSECAIAILHALNC
jgi:hypothetical protein